MTVAPLILTAVSAAAHADFGLAALSTLRAEAAATSSAATKEGWQGSMSMGYVATTGNSNTRSLNAQGLAAYRTDGWANVLSAQAMKSSFGGRLTSESLNLGAQSDYNLTRTNYVFGSLYYLRDTFAGYRGRNSEVVGYGRRLLTTDTQRLDMEIGVGARQTRLTDNSNEREFVQRLAASYLWTFADKSAFSQTLGLEHGANNTFIRSVTSLTTNLVDSFALSVSYTISHNTHPEPGFRSTDTVTSVSLIYTF